MSDNEIKREQPSFEVSVVSTNIKIVDNLVKEMVGEKK